MTMIANETTADLRWADPLAHHPGSPRWIFFDDIPPSKEERKARAELIAALEKECANRSPDWVDPEIDRYHARIRVRTLEIWLANWYKRNAPDPRIELVLGLMAAELNPNSVISKIREGLKDYLTPGQIEEAWIRLSPYRAIRDALQRPSVVNTLKSDYVNLTRHEPVVKYYRANDGPEANIRVFYEAKHSWKAQRETVYVCPKQAGELNTWHLIHKWMGYPTRPYETEYRPSRRTLYANPDGSKFLNTTTRERSPIQAKKAFSKRHKIPEDRVMVERVHMEQWNEDWLRQHKLNAVTIGKHLFVVSARKLSNEAPSQYYDPNPTFIETLDDKGKWVTQYSYTIGRLHAVGPNTTIPHGAHRLTVREFERAVISGADLIEDDIDDVATNYEEAEDNPDDRERSADNLPRRSVAKLPEAEQMLHAWLLNAELHDIADMLTVDFDNIPRNEESMEAHTICTIINTLQPSVHNERWNDLVDFIHTTVKNEGYAWTIIKTLTLLLAQLEAVASLPPGEA